MIIGIPKEIKIQENRVSITPENVKKLTKNGHQVFVEKNAGLGSNYSNEQYQKNGAKILQTAEAVFAKSELILKVKEPQEIEIELLNENHLLFTYLHLASCKTLTEKLLKSKCTAIAYETIQVDGKLPLLEPMSIIAGRMAPLVGSYHLAYPFGGYGILSSGTDTIASANTSILGGGISGLNAAIIASGLQSNVTILELNPKRIEFLKDYFSENSFVKVIESTPANILEFLSQSHLTIGAILIAGASAPKIINEEILAEMPKRSIFVDISVDQGGCSTTTRPTSHENPTYEEQEILHYCVANMPGAYPRTATEALSNATFPWLELIANNGIDKACSLKSEIIGGINCQKGKLLCSGVAEAHQLKLN